MATAIPFERFRFGVFEVDLRSGELRKQGIKIKLHDQPFQVLAVLLEHRGEVVTREQLQQKLWPADTFVDFDRGLNSAVKKLRDALGDSADAPRYLETLPRRGYRLIAAVDTVWGDQHGIAAKEQPKFSSRHKLWALAAGVTAAVLLVLLFGLNVGGLRERLLSTVAASPIQSLAVLPFENQSGDPTEENFADGMTDALITDLGKLGALRVISRTSAMHYKGSKKLLPEIARELNVDAVVEGAVLRSGNRVRITAQLIRATPEKHLWADSYERDLQDVLALQRDVARAVAAQVHVALTPQQQQRLGTMRAINPGAYRAYLNAKHFLNNQRNEAGAQKAVEYSLEATRLDPNSALAFAGLSNSYAALSYLGDATPHECMPKAQAAAERALALDPDLAEAHTALERVLRTYTLDWRSSERELKRALELNPSDSEAHESYAWYLVTMGQVDQAVIEAKRARELDPLSMLSNRTVGSALYFARRYDEALVELQHTAEMFPNSTPNVFYWLSLVYQFKGMPEKVVEMDLERRALRGEKPEKLAAIRRAVQRSGMPAYWAALYRDALPRAREEHVPCYDCAYANIAQGKRDEAFKLLEDSYQERVFWITLIKVDPELDPVRSDPRFQDLVRRMGLPP